MKRTTLAVAAIMVAISPSYSAPGVLGDQDGLAMQREGVAYSSRRNTRTVQERRANDFTMPDSYDFREYQLFSPNGGF